MYRPNYSITNHIVGRIAEIEALRSTIAGAHILPERQIEMRLRATVEKAHDSTSIEGNPLTLKQVRAALAGKTLTRNEYAILEVRNYRAALDLIEKRANPGGGFTPDDLLLLHATAMKGLLPQAKAGAFRKGDIYIVDQDDKPKYKGPSAKQAKRLTGDLCAWLQGEAAEIHPCIAAAILHYQLVTIHPFSDGNGRTARLAVMWYLAVRGYDFNASIVLDSYYAQDKDEYYAALHSCQGSAYDETADITAWITYFADGFLSSAKVLAAEITLLSLLAPGHAPARLSANETALLSYAKEFGSIRIAEAEEILKGTPRRTIQRLLRKLVDAGYLKQANAGKATEYTLPGPA